LGGVSSWRGRRRRRMRRRRRRRLCAPVASHLLPSCGKPPSAPMVECTNKSCARFHPLLLLGPQNQACS
jgi:hypothetical protein